MTETSGQAPPARLLWGVFMLALLARLAWQLAVGTPTDWPDTALYIADGNGLFAAGRAVSDRYMPLYPVLIHLTGPDGVLWLQAVLSALTAVLVALLAFQLSGSAAAAAIGGLFAAVNPVLIFYAHMRLTETVFALLLTGALAAFYGRRWGAGSVLLVLGILTRPAVDLIAPLLVLAFCVVHGEWRWRPMVRRLGLYAAVYAGLMAPWWLHNIQAYGSFVRLDLGDGIVMRLENNPLFDRVGLDFPALGPVTGEFDHLGPVAANAARKAAALAYIAAQPAHYLERCLERFARFWTPVPGSAKAAVNLLAAAAILPVFLGAFVALARADGRQWRRLLPILLIVLYLTAVHSAFHALPRYRLPLDPLLMAVAAGWYATLLERRRAGLASGPAAS